MRYLRWLLLAGGAAILVVLFIVLRPGSDEPEPRGTGTPTPTDTATVAPTTTDETTEPTSTPSPDAVEIEVEDGVVDGPERITVAQGDQVRITVKADVTDEVHVHGYDLMFDATPGEEVLIEFEANVSGIFEIELEDAGLLLTQLEVTA